MINNENIHEIINIYIDDPSQVTQVLGPINTWNVSKVTNMKDLFKNKTTFNENINDWHVSNVTSMESMFEGALTFNQPLDKWRFI